MHAPNAPCMNSCAVRRGIYLPCPNVHLPLRVPFFTHCTEDPTLSNDLALQQAQHNPCMPISQERRGTAFFWSIAVVHGSLSSLAPASSESCSRRAAGASLSGGRSSCPSAEEAAPLIEGGSGGSSRPLLDICITPACSFCWRSSSFCACVRTCKVHVQGANLLQGFNLQTVVSSTPISYETIKRAREELKCACSLRTCVGLRVPTCCEIAFTSFQPYL